MLVMMMPADDGLVAECVYVDGRVHTRHMDGLDVLPVYDSLSLSLIGRRLLHGAGSKWKTELIEYGIYD